MAWLDTVWRRRTPITVITDSSAATRDVQVTIPTGWDVFWENIDASGNSLRITGADGVTPIVYALAAGFNKTTKTCTINIESAPMPTSADRAVLIWLYHSPTSPQSSGAGSATMTTPLTGRIELGAPSREEVVAITSQPPNTTVPTKRIGKLASVSRFVWLDFSEAVQRAGEPYNGRMEWEEPAIANVAVLDSTATPDATMVVAADMRWVSVRDGARAAIYLRLRLQAGTSGQRYTLVGQFQTATPNAAPHRIVEDRVGVDVYNLLET